MSAPALTQADLPQVLQCLQAALQPSNGIQKQAESHLAALEQRPGFCSCLAEIMLNKEADHSARWLASVQLKNSISKHWRSSKLDPRSIAADEKSHLRSVLPRLIAQDDNQVAVQVALTWAKVARQDYPTEWPSLFNDLLGLLSAPGASQLAIRRTLLVLHHTTKELASKRLAADQRNFAQVAALLFTPVWSQWWADTTSLLSALPEVLAGNPAPGATPPSPAPAQQLLVTLERWLMLLKILRRLVVFGHVSDQKSLQAVQEVTVCAPAMLQALQQLVAVRPAGGARASQQHAVNMGKGHHRHQLIAMLERGVLKQAKVLVGLQEAHPWSFHACGVLVPMLSYCCEQLLVNQSHGGGMTVASGAWDRYLIQCMLFVMNVMKSTSAYRSKAELTDHEQDAPRHALVGEVTSALTAWWTPDRLTSLSRALITGYCRLTVRDLEEWQASPEDFYHAGDVSGWQEHVGLAAEALFLSLLQDHRQLLGGLVISMLQEASAACPLEALTTQPDMLPGGVSVIPGSHPLRVPNALLALDAALGAVATGAYELHDCLDYSTWLRTSLIPMLGSQGPVLVVLRRRAMRVIAAWVARLEDVDRPAVYSAVLGCMGEQDACMQLTAVSCMHALIDDWNFNEQQFEQFVELSMQQLLRVLAQHTALDSQTQAFNLMNLIIERMGDLIRPWAEPFSALLPGLWEAAADQSLLRIQVLLALQRLVNVLGMQSPLMYPLLLPLLRYATDPAQPEALQLLEDGLGLWLVAVRNAPSFTPDLLALLPHLTRVLTGSTEHIAIGMALLTSAALMARDQLSGYAQEVNGCFEVLVGGVNERGMLLLLPALEMVISASPAIIPALRPALTKLLALMINGQESPQVQAAGCCVLSRLLLLVPATELSTLLAALGGDPAAQLTKLVELWTEHFDSLGQPRQRKLSALGLCSLLAQAASPPVLASLDVVIACVTGVWSELESRAPQPGGDELAGSWAVWADVDSGCEAALSSAVASEDAEGESFRRQMLRSADPLPAASLRAALGSALEAARGRVGQALDVALAGLDPSIAAQLQAMLQAA